MKNKIFILRYILIIQFILSIFLVVSCTTSPKPNSCESTSFKPIELNPVLPRQSGQFNVLELATEPIDTVRIGFIGLGSRGTEAIKRYTFIDGVQIVAICDVVPENVEKNKRFLIDKGHPAPDTYTGVEDWKLICERDDIDLIYVCTHWDLHTPIAVYAMENGKHVATEVPAALTVDECWQLVNTAEKTRKHCIQLENCIYDFFEITTLNMAQKGLFGDIVHAEGAYIHDLRWLNFDLDGYWNMWRLKHLEKSDGNTYPTHGLGPVSHLLNIHRGDKMNYLVSMSTNQFGMTEYAKNKFGEDSDFAKREYKKGDMNTTLIKTEKGKTIMLQHDVTSPRPYSRLHTISGTKGFAQKYPKERIALEIIYDKNTVSLPDVELDSSGIRYIKNAHSFVSEAELDSLLLEYAHPIVKNIEKKAKEVGGHGGMDFIMDYRLIYCLRNGLPLDQDVYDAAEWSSIIELSRRSVENNSIPVIIPDFTRGAWNMLDKVRYFE
ncbi:Gfo/Idh/MocA family protein [Candidatus Neomarinimicrobiota bacterium]